jgi:hypothetical protein
VEELLEVPEPSVRPAEDRHVLECHAVPLQRADPVDDEVAFGFGGRERLNVWLRPVGA